MDDEWNALEHYLLTRAPRSPDRADAEAPEPAVVVAIPTLELDEVPAAPVVVLGAGPAPG